MGESPDLTPKKSNLAGWWLAIASLVTVLMSYWEGVGWLTLFTVLGVGWILLWVLWRIPRWQAERSFEGELKGEDAARVENEFRRTLAQILGGAILLGGLWVTWSHGQKQEELTEEGQATQRFATAVGLLGSDNQTLRIGGVYALERIARDSIAERRQAMEVLSAFVREAATKAAILQAGRRQLERQKRGQAEIDETVGHWEADRRALADGIRLHRFWPTEDVQAALSVIGRRQRCDADGRLRPGEDARLSLAGARLDGARLVGADLSFVDLRDSDLTDADLTDAVMNAADLGDSWLVGTRLVGAKLRKANFERAKGKHTNLTRADLSGASLHNASFVEPTFTSAILAGAQWGDSEVNAPFIGLTQAQLDSSCIDPDLGFAVYMNSVRNAGYSDPPPCQQKWEPPPPPPC